MIEFILLLLGVIFISICFVIGSVLVHHIIGNSDIIKIGLRKTIWNFIFLVPVFGLLFSTPGDRNYMLNSYPGLYMSWHAIFVVIISCII